MTEEDIKQKAKEYTNKNNTIVMGFEEDLDCTDQMQQAFIDGYHECQKEHKWHYLKDGDLPRQDGHTCFSINVLASNKKWVYYQFGSGKWFCGNKEVKVTAWKEIVFPELPKE